jgi:hypothetical protein
VSAAAASPNAPAHAGRSDDRSVNLLGKKISPDTIIIAAAGLLGALLLYRRSQPTPQATGTGDPGAGFSAGPMTGNGCPPGYVNASPYGGVACVSSSSVNSPPPSNPSPPATYKPAGAIQGTPTGFVAVGLSTPPVTDYTHRPPGGSYPSVSPSGYRLGG